MRLLNRPIAEAKEPAPAPEGKRRPGRPRKEEEEKAQQTWIRCQTHVRQKLRVLAALADRDMSEVLDELLARELRAQGIDPGTLRPAVGGVRAAALADGLRVGP